MKADPTLKSIYSTKENGNVNTGKIFLKTSETELTTMLNVFKDTSYQSSSGWGDTGMLGLSTEGFLSYYYSQNTAENRNDTNLALGSIVTSFADTMTCQKPWDCYFDESWDNETIEACESLNLAWYKHRQNFEEKWSKVDTVNTSLSEYHINFFLGYCSNTGEYQRAADYNSGGASGGKVAVIWHSVSDGVALESSDGIEKSCVTYASNVADEGEGDYLKVEPNA